MDVGAGQDNVAPSGSTAPRRPTLRVSGTAKKGQLESRSRRTLAATPSRRPADPPAVTEVEGSAAASLLQAAVEAANTLGDVRVEGDLNPAEVLQEPSTREAATKWRSGSAARRITAALARLTTSLQTWAAGSNNAAAQAGRLIPVRAQPLQGGPQAPPRWPSLEGFWRAARAWRWTWLAVMVVLLFPKAVALCVVLACRYVVKGVVALIIYFGKELLHQLAMTVHEVEDALVDVLSSYLQPSPQPLGYGSFLPSVLSGPPLQMGDKPDSPSPPPTPTTEVTQPTRPLDVLTVLLLVANLFRGQPGGGGGANPQG